MEQRIEKVKFYGDELLGVKDEKGVIWLGVKRACECLGLTEGQMKNERKKIQEDLVLSQGGRNLILLTKGGEQKVLCIKEDFITLWLAKITLTPKMKLENPELIDKLVKYQLECAKILHQHFMGTEEKKEKFFDEMGIKGIIEDSIQKAIVPLQNEIRELKIQNKNNLIELQEVTARYKIYRNPSNEFSRAVSDYCDIIHPNVISDTQKHYLFWCGLCDWFGIDIDDLKKKSNKKQWLLNNIGIETIVKFANGVFNKRIVKSIQGHFIDLSGIWENSIEWNKILKDWTDSKGHLHCAYCGKIIDSEDAQKEHMIPQSHIDSTNCIQNIIPACSDCNKLKFNERYDVWYPKQSFYREDLFDWMKEHINKYKIDDKYLHIQRNGIIEI